MFHRAILVAALLAAPVALHAAPKTPSLEQRVQRMEDESVIRKMVVEYGAFLDAKDYASYAALFAPDGEWVGGFGSLGKAEAGYVNKTSFHMLTNPLIEIDGDTAHVTSKYLFWTKSADNKPVPNLAGRYVDEFVRVNGVWKIKRRTTYGVFPYRDPAHPETNDPAPAIGAAAAPTLEARLQKAEDTIAIQRVITDYSKFIDAQDYESYAGLFAREGTWQTGNTVRKGPDEIKAMLVGLFGTPPPGFVNTDSYHLVSNIEVNVDGDHATARSRHLLVMRGAGGAPTPMLAGRYEDEFIREGGKWKILHRTDFPVMPTSEEWIKVINARNAARAAKK
jgi:uncharacterized protein (TIGR02246 family)